MGSLFKMYNAFLRKSIAVLKAESGFQNRDAMLMGEYSFRD